MAASRIRLPRPSQRTRSSKRQHLTVWLRSSKRPYLQDLLPAEEEIGSGRLHLLAEAADLIELAVVSAWARAGG